MHFSVLRSSDIFFFASLSDQLSETSLILPYLVSVGRAIEYPPRNKEVKYYIGTCKTRVDSDAILIFRKTYQKTEPC